MGVLPRLVVVDTETTGLDARRDAVIQVALARREPDGEVREGHWLINPERTIPPDILRLTGLDGIDFTQCPPITAVAGEIANFVDGAPLVGHNVDFDYQFLTRFGIHPQERVDTLQWARIALPGRPSYRLSDLFAGTDYRFHDAREDCRATLELVEQIYIQLGQLPKQAQRDLERILGSEWTWWGIESASSTISQAPLYNPGRESYSPEGPPLEPMAEIGQAMAYLAPDGPIARAVPGFEPRPQQQQMAQAIVQAWPEGRIVMVEAGTGTGKSLAYLVPAAVNSVRAGERAVVATHTLALQEQLWNKDWPTVAASVPASATVLKGRGRYLCLLKLDEVVATTTILADDRAWRHAVASLIVFSCLGTRGDAEEWNPRGDAAAKLWESVVADRNACRGARCDFAGPCFMRQARRTADGVHVLIVNHALLAAHLAQGNVLPEFQHVIIDEAHHFAEVVERALGFDLALEEFVRTVGDLEHTLFGVLVGSMRSTHPDLGAGLDQLRSELKDAAAAATRLSHLLAQELNFEAYSVQSQRITESRWQQLAGQPIGDELASLSQHFHRLVTDGGQILAQVEAVFGDVSNEEIIWLRYRKWLDDVENIAAGLSRFGQPDPDWVSWFEGTLRNVEVTIRLRRGPVVIADILRQRLWDTIKGGVLTSATLSVGGRFDFLVSTLGIPRGRLQPLQLASPFDLTQQARLVVPKHLSPVDSAEHLVETANFVAEAAVRLGGRTLVLLNSYRALRNLANAVRERLAETGILTLAQGIDGSGPHLVERFRQGGGSVLIGVASLWEGVDVPGDALSLVVIGRLPFATPGDPMEDARLERIRSQGGIPFYQRTLPQAILKFQQGFGRLIRSHRDHGVVVVLDPRILPQGSRYGHQFIRAVHPVPLVVADRPRVLAEIDRMLRLPPSEERI